MIFLGLGFDVKSSFFDKNKSTNLPKSLGLEEKIKGVFEEQKEESKPGSSSIQQRLEIIKREVNSINIKEIASSSPQIQKILLDLKNLQSLPENQAREACYNICKGL